MTTGSTINILVVDDDQDMLDIISTRLRQLPVSISTVTNGEQAWQQLEQDPSAYDLLLLDRIMPGMDGIKLVSMMKSHPILREITVVLQTAVKSHDSIVEGLNAGIFYYLTKPYTRKNLLSVVSTALQDLEYNRELRKKLHSTTTPGQLLKKGSFRIRTLKEATSLATILAQSYPDPEKAVLGLSELMINAIEHGNLGITYDEKSSLQMNGDWANEVERRLALPENIDQHAEVHFSRNDEKITVSIIDQGRGFNWQKYIDLDISRIYDTHGRGIAISQGISFDEVEYNESGNQVTASVFLEKNSQIPL